MKSRRAFGLVGLGRMGANLALQALEKKIRVIGFDLKGAPEELRRAGLEAVKDLIGFRTRLPAPRVVLVYVPAGPVVDRVLDDLCAALEPGDLLVDGGNSYWGDSIRRQARLADRGFRFVDLGTSGGWSGARHGACFMAGGEAEDFASAGAAPRRAGRARGALHAGPAGSGHFVKLVHNGIEFGMLQAIGEGVDLLLHSGFPWTWRAVLHNWNHGSVIRSWLVELLEQAWKERGGLEGIPSYVEDTGEVNWLVSDALHMEVPIPVIGQAVQQLFASRDQQRNWARAIAMMRHGFGGHPFGPDAGVVRERREGRVGPFPTSPAGRR